MSELFIVGCNVGPGRPWIFVGAFDSREKAIDACKDARYFVGPATLNTAYGSPAKPWPGAEVPKGKEALAERIHQSELALQGKGRIIPPKKTEDLRILKGAPR